MINRIGHSPISWILDSHATSLICVSMLVLKGIRSLEKQEVVLRIGNGALIEPLAMKTTFVTLHSRHVITLKDFLFLPNTFHNIVSIPRLIKDGMNFLLLTMHVKFIIVMRLLAWACW